MVLALFFALSNSQAPAMSHCVFVVSPLSVTFIKEWRRLLVKEVLPWIARIRTDKKNVEKFEFVLGRPSLALPLNFPPTPHALPTSTLPSSCPPFIMSYLLYALPHSCPPFFTPSYNPALPLLLPSSTPPPPGSVIGTAHKMVEEEEEQKQDEGRRKRRPGLSTDIPVRGCPIRSCRIGRARRRTWKKGRRCRTSLWWRRIW